MGEYISNYPFGYPYSNTNTNTTATRGSRKGSTLIRTAREERGSRKGLTLISTAREEREREIFSFEVFAGKKWRFYWEVPAFLNHPFFSLFLLHFLPLLREEMARRRWFPWLVSALRIQMKEISWKGGPFFFWVSQLSPFSNPEQALLKSWWKVSLGTWVLFLASFLF